MIRTLGRRTFLASLAADPFRDPAPPQVLDPPTVDPPVPRDHPELTAAGKPARLHRDARVEDWPGFLGPTHNAVSGETRLRKRWPRSGPPLVWEMKKGTGYSSPSLAGDYLVYLHRTGAVERIECLHPETGRKYWDFTYPTQFEDRYGYNNGPRSSPAIDRDRVYTYGAEGKLHCLRLRTGQLLWKRDLAKEFKVPQDFFGTATSPLIDGELVILNLGAPGGPTVAAFERLTGRLAWGAGTDWGPGYATPVPATMHGKRWIFVFAGGESDPPKGGLMGLEAATGATAFVHPWRSRSYESVNASNPVVHGNEVFVSASYRTGGSRVEVLPDGKHKVVWTSQQIGTHFNTAVYRDGHLYAFDGRNEPDASLVCVDWNSGKLVWRKSLEWEETLVVDGVERRRAMSPYRGTLLSVDGKFLCLGEWGHLMWLDLSPSGCTEISRAWLFAAPESWSLPVISRGLLYVSQHRRDVLNRTGPRLLCYDLRASE